MAKMGRPKKLEEPQYAGVILEKRHRDMIEAGRGDETFSEYIRECITIRFAPEEETELKEAYRLRGEKILEQAKQIKQYEQAEQRRQKVNEEQLAYIGRKYMAWEKTTGLNNGRTRLAWAQGCVLGLLISPEDALSYLQGQGFFALE